MRRRFGQALRIGVAAHALALVKTSRWQGAPLEVLAEQRVDPEAPDALATGLVSLLADSACANWPVTVVVADELTRLWQVTPPPGSARVADLEAAAALRFQTLYGDNAALWQMSAGWDAVQPFMAAATPRHLVSLLQQAGAAHKFTVVEIVPQFIAGWNRWRGTLKADAWYALVHEHVLTIGVVEQGALQAVRSAALPQGASLDWLAGHVAREALRLNLAPPARLNVSGRAPVAWSSGTSHYALACHVLAPAKDVKLSHAARLAATGSHS